MLSGSGYGFAAQPDGLTDHGVDGLLDDRQICTGVDQRAQQHVARDSSGGIDPGVAVLLMAGRRDLGCQVTGTVAVVDIHHRHAGRAGVEHR